MKQLFTFLTLALLIAVSPVKAETVLCTVYDWSWNVVGADFEAELTIDSDGVYTLTPFLNSGSPISFKADAFSAPEDNMSYADLTFTGNISVEDGYIYLMDADNEDYMECQVFDVSGTGSTTVGWPYVFEDGYSYLTHYVDFKDHDGWKEYDGTICVSGYDNAADKWLSGGYYIYFLFDDLSSSGVSQEIADENAPVEYFNLQGVKVANPENGIFIRRQGKEVKKVVIK